MLSCALWDPWRVSDRAGETSSPPLGVYRVSSDPRVIWCYAAIGLVVSVAGSAGSLLAGKDQGVPISAGAGILISLLSVVLWFEGGQTTYLCDGQRLQVHKGSKIVFDHPVSEIASVGIEPLLGPAEFMTSTPIAPLPALWVRLVSDNRWAEPVRTRDCAIWGHERIFAVEKALAAACGPTTKVTRDTQVEPSRVVGEAFESGGFRTDTTARWHARMVACLPNPLSIRDLWI
ncbi:MAG: hypothetical protein JWR52_1785 [Marmoricola sp.]|nr:hypothetical protein [Marmoricola sp.]